MKTLVTTAVKVLNFILVIWCPLTSSQPPVVCRFASDVTVFAPRRAWNLQRINDANNPIREVERQNGNTGRVEYLYAEVRKRHLKKGTDPNNASRIYARGLGRPKDDAGHIIAKRLGGSGTEEYNLFPQSRNIIRGVWRDHEALVADSFRNDKDVAKMTFRFNYNDPTLPNRPSCFTYKINFPDGKEIVSNMVNP